MSYLPSLGACGDGMAFFNRERELEDVRQALTSRRSELMIVYGRRGVGKSALLAEALSGRPHLFYQATTRTLPLQHSQDADSQRCPLFRVGPHAGLVEQNQHRRLDGR